MRLTWPQPLSALWNGVRHVDPEPGSYELTVRIGYAETPQPGDGIGHDRRGNRRCDQVMIAIGYPASPNIQHSLTQRP